MKKIKYYIRRIKGEIIYLSRYINYCFTLKKRAIYVGCTGLGNLGDDAILDAINQMLQPKVLLYDLLYADPIAGGFLRKIKFTKPDFIILGGGTLVKKGKSESYLRLLNDNITKWPKAKVIIMGPGVVDPQFANDIGFPIIIDDWKEVFENAEFLSVRGLNSKKELESWNMDKEVYVLHDPVVWFTRLKYKTKQKSKTIGLNFADIGDRIYGNDKSKIKPFVSQLVNYLETNEWQIYLVPTTKSDLDFMLSYLEIKPNKNIHIYNNYKNLELALNFIEELDMFIGQRLHSIVFSACVSTPFLAVEYEPKTSDFLNTLGMPEYKIRIDKLNLNSVIDFIAKTYEDLELEQKHLANQIKMAKFEQQTVLKRFLNTIN